jgi:short subunit dehydrogenase-like uncharacterized protein
MRRVILFGAGGYTGRLTAEVMVRAGLTPVLAGRSGTAMQKLVGDLAHLAPLDAAPTWAVADAADPASLRALITSPEDVLVTTVGPFTLMGRPAIEAAIAAGATYIDSTGEGPFIHDVFTTYHEQALATGARLLTAFGYDYVPGNLAAELLLAELPGTTPRVEMGYFVTGKFGMSSGTKASVAALMAADRYVFHGGELGTTRSAPAVAEFTWADGTQRQALAITGTEQFTLPPRHPHLIDVDVYLGWAGSSTKAVAAGGAVAGAIARTPVVGERIESEVQKRLAAKTGEGPDAESRAGSRSIALARAFDGVGTQLGQVEVHGPNGYDLTAELLAWAAAMAATGRIQGTGALGPAQAFGLDALVEGCALMGLRRV